LTVEETEPSKKRKYEVGRVLGLNDGFVPPFPMNMSEFLFNPPPSVGGANQTLATSNVVEGQDAEHEEAQTLGEDGEDVVDQGREEDTSPEGHETAEGGNDGKMDTST